MTFLVALLVVLCFPVAFVAGGVAVNAWLEGDKSMASKSLLIFAVCVAVIFVAPKRAPEFGSGNCYTEWDGRSNPTVCD